MNMIRKIIPITATLAIAFPAIAADKDAKELEKQAIGYWAPDTEAMTRILTQQMKMDEEDAAKVVAEFTQIKITVQVERGTAHVYTKQGVVSGQYEILEADKETGTLTLQALSPPDAPKPPPGAPKPQAVKIAIKDDQITVTGAAGQVPFVLRKIDEDEFKRRKADVPNHKVGP